MKADEMISKRVVLEEIKKEMPINRMDTDEEVAMERLFHRIVARIDAIRAADVPLTQTQLREMNHQMVWCVELNMPVEVYAPKKGFILVRYKTPSTDGSEYAMDLTLYAKMPAEEREESGGRD